jgi:micrococcal nuclease
VAAPATSGADKDCPDFSSHAEAQAYYDAQGGVGGGDPDGLDADKDGSACETLP